ncbi:MAG TPA: S-layer homology domain-containing protein [Anaerovoracaceae bacterium]|nr:S-layer homology domain-containing protein [Anaerovoracaceae bacterium]
MYKNLSRTFIAFLIVSMVICLIPSTAFAATDDTANDIKYSMESDETLDFDKDDFNKECDDVTGEELDYVKFTTLPDDADGVLYYDYDEDLDDDEQTEVSSSKKYYFSDSTKLSKVTFVPDEDYSDTLTIKYKGYDVDGNSYTGEIKITVDESDSSNSNVIKYSADEEEAVEFDEDDFSDVCDDVQSEDLDYVKFTLPDADDGILYYDYDEDDDSNSEVSSSKKYYYEGTSPYIKNITFVPDDDFSGTVTIKYTGYDVQGDNYTGKVKITIGDGSNSDSNSSDKIINYTIDDNDKVVDFDEDDFNDVSNAINDEDLDYIKITIPSATKGILYYNYTNGNYSSIVSSGKKYYYDTSQYIKEITFVPNKDFNGTCKIDFTGYDVNGDSFPGVITITVGSAVSTTASAITYASTVNNTTTFKDEDFNRVCKSILDTSLSYVQFTLPSSSNGTLYYGYSSNGNYTSKVKESTKYYYGSSPYLLNVTFVPANDITGTVTISYKGYDTNDLSYTGKVQINITKPGTSVPTSGGITLVSSKYFSDVDISYSWAVPYIDNLYEAGIISGATSGSSKLYSPASYVTRGDFIYLLYKALDFKTTSTTTGFSDVTSGSYYYAAITTAKALGIAQGSDNKFYPNNRITREDAMVMVLRAVNITGKTISSGDTGSLSKYNDGSSISDYSKSAVAALIKAGIITGSDDNKIYPQGNLTRAQIAAIIYRVKNL